MGLIITDASYHQEMKYTSIGIIDLNTGIEKKEELSTLSNIKDAESYGIIKALKVFAHEYDSITIFCDNMYSVFETRKKVINSKYWKTKYNIIQIIWVPREYTGKADAISRICISEEKTKEIKKESYVNNVLKETSIVDVFLKESDFSNLIKEIYRNHIDLSLTFKSEIFKNIVLENKLDLKQAKLELELIKDDSLFIIEKLPLMEKDNSPLKKILKIILTQ